MGSRKTNLVKRLKSGWRPELMVRLSHLIIVQVIFVFAALVLLIFGPHDEIRFSTATGAPHDDSEVFASRIADVLADRTPDGGRFSDESIEILEDLLSQNSDIVEAAVYCTDGAGTPLPLFTYRHDTDRLEPMWSGDDIPVLIDLLAEGNATSEPLPFLVTQDYVVYGSPLIFADGSPGMLVAAWDHRLVLSDRGTLGYALLLLFLGAALVALLTVYLIHRHFTRPLHQMVRSVEKTTDGELCYLIENASESELSRLAGVFNKLSQTIWKDHRKILQYGDRLQTARDSLRKSEHLLSTIIEKSPEGIITTSPDGTIMLCNHRAEEIFGFNDGEAVGRSLDDLFHNGVTERTTTGRRNKEDLGFEVIGKRSDNSQFAAYLITSRLQDDAGECIGHVYIVRDISQSKDYQEMMIRIDRYYTRGEMASEIAHEINNYLSILMGNVELVPLMIKKNDPERLTAKLELMHQTIEKIARFTDGLLDGSHDEIRFEQADINQIVENVIAFLKPQNRFDYTEVQTELSSDIPLVKVDPGLIQQLLVNLIYNAGDAVFDIEGEKSITVRTFLTGENADTLGITVRDNGPGVRPDKVPLLFNKRFTTKPRGHGIGLITCRRILDSHDGTITYEYDGGAIFTVTVPVEQLPAIDNTAKTVDSLSTNS